MASNQPSDVSLQPPANDQAGPGGLQAADAGAVQDPVLSDEAGEGLDQEWVNKAKDIVERTKADPFTQVNELSKVKAGYLKARYNKDFKVEDSA